MADLQSKYDELLLQFNDLQVACDEQREELEKLRAACDDVRLNSFDSFSLV